MGITLGKSGAYRPATSTQDTVDEKELDAEGKFSSQYYANAYEESLSSLLVESKQQGNNVQRKGSVKKAKCSTVDLSRGSIENDMAHRPKRAHKNPILHRHSIVGDYYPTMPPYGAREPLPVAPQATNPHQGWVYSTLPRPDIQTKETTTKQASQKTRSDISHGSCSNDNGTTNSRTKSWNSNEVGLPLGTVQHMYGAGGSGTREDFRVCHWIRDVNKQTVEMPIDPQNPVTLHAAAHHVPVVQMRHPEKKRKGSDRKSWPAPLSQGDPNPTRPPEVIDDERHRTMSYRQASLPQITVKTQEPKKKSRPHSMLSKSDIFKILRRKRKSGQLPVSDDKDEHDNTKHKGVQNPQNHHYNSTPHRATDVNRKTAHELKRVMDNKDFTGIMTPTKPQQTNKMTKKAHVSQKHAKDVATRLLSPSSSFIPPPSPSDNELQEYQYNNEPTSLTVTSLKSEKQHNGVHNRHSVESKTGIREKGVACGSYNVKKAEMNHDYGTWPRKSRENTAPGKSLPVPDIDVLSLPNNAPSVPASDSGARSVRSSASYSVNSDFELASPMGGWEMGTWPRSKKCLSPQIESENDQLLLALEFEKGQEQFDSMPIFPPGETVPVIGELEWQKLERIQISEDQPPIEFNTNDFVTSSPIKSEAKSPFLGGISKYNVKHYRSVPNVACLGQMTNNVPCMSLKSAKPCERKHYHSEVSLRPQDNLPTIQGPSQINDMKMEISDSHQAAIYNLPIGSGNIPCVMSSSFSGGLFESVAAPHMASCHSHNVQERVDHTSNDLHHQLKPPPKEIEPWEVNDGEWPITDLDASLKLDDSSLPFAVSDDNTIVDGHAYSCKNVEESSIKCDPHKAVCVEMTDPIPDQFDFPGDNERVKKSHQPSNLKPSHSDSSLITENSSRNHQHHRNKGTNHRANKKNPAPPRCSSSSNVGRSVQENCFIEKRPLHQSPTPKNIDSELPTKNINEKPTQHADSSVVPLVTKCTFERMKTKSPTVGKGIVQVAHQCSIKKRLDEEKETPSAANLSTNENKSEPTIEDGESGIKSHFAGSEQKAHLATDVDNMLSNNKPVKSCNNAVEEANVKHSKPRAGFKEGENGGFARNGKSRIGDQNPLVGEKPGGLKHNDVPDAGEELGLNPIPNRKHIENIPAVSSAFVKHFQAKAILLGDVAAGKTSFLNAMRLQAAKLTPAGADGRTIGIEVHSVDLRQNMRLWFYDFGGHETYHFSQQLFLTDKAIYIIVVDIATYLPEKFSKTIQYWYDVLTSCLHQPVICVLATHTDQADAPDVAWKCKDIKEKLQNLEEEQVQVLHAQLDKIENSIKKFAQCESDPIRDFQLHSLEKPLERINNLLERRPKIMYEVNCVSSKTMDGVQAVCDKLANVLTESGDHFPASYIPESWLALADVIVSKREELPYLSKEQFEATATELNIKGKNIQLALHYLQSVGVILHYDDFKKHSDLHNYVFNNANLLLAIFGLIFNHNYYLDEIGYVWKNRNMLKIPRFDFERLRTNLKEEAFIGEQLLKCFWDAIGIGADVFQSILSLLEKFDLCYEVVLRKDLHSKLPKGRHFCFPYLLKETVPTRVPLLWPFKIPEGCQEYQLLLVFSRQTLPMGFMERISVRMNPYFDSRLDWKRGFVAFCNDAQDIVKVETQRDEQDIALALKVRTREAKNIMARHILLILVAIINRVLSRQYPGVTAVWYALCGHCIRLSQERFDIRVDRFPADNIVFANEGSGPIQCKNCTTDQILEISDIFPVKSEASGTMRPHLTRAIRNIQPKFVQQVDADDLLPMLLKKGVLDVPTHEYVMQTSPPSLRNEILLDALTKKNDAAFDTLVAILKASKYQTLASDLQNAAVTAAKAPKLQALPLLCSNLAPFGAPNPCVPTDDHSRSLEDDSDSVVTSDSGMVGSMRSGFEEEAHASVSPQTIEDIVPAGGADSTPSRPDANSPKTIPFACHDSYLPPPGVCVPVIQYAKKPLYQPISTLPFAVAPAPHPYGDIRSYPLHPHTLSDRHYASRKVKQHSKPRAHKVSDSRMQESALYAQYVGVNPLKPHTPREVVHTTRGAKVSASAHSHPRPSHNAHNYKKRSGHSRRQEPETATRRTNHRAFCFTGVPRDGDFKESEV